MRMTRAAVGTSLALASLILAACGGGGNWSCLACG